MPPTPYNFADRFKEVESYAGIIVGVLGVVMPNVISPDQLVHVLTPVAAIIGCGLFFMPQNRIVLDAEQTLSGMVSFLPAEYQAAVKPVVTAAEAQPASTGGAIAAVLGMAAISSLLTLAACGGTTGVPSLTAAQQAAVVGAAVNGITCAAQVANPVTKDAQQTGVSDITKGEAAATDAAGVLTTSTACANAVADGVAALPTPPPPPPVVTDALPKTGA